MKYVALLRGINVGGNNKVTMSELRACFESLGFIDVTTYINSGNVLFSSVETNEAELVAKCEAAIEQQFGFPVVVMVIAARDLKTALAHAPDWWAKGDPKSVRHDALFVIPPTTSTEALNAMLPKPSSVDKLEAYGQVIFWTVDRKDYRKSIVPKMIGTPIYSRITMRSFTTTKKLCDLVGDV